MQIGWNTPDKYLTIQLADLDGDTKAELVGRGPEAIESYSWNGKEWVELGGASLALSDLSGWNDPSLYSTIQFADVTGDRGAELIVRGHDGLYVSRYTATGWTQVAALAESAHGVGRRRLAAPRNVLDDPGRKHRRRRKGGDHRQGGQRGPDMDVRLRISASSRRPSSAGSPSSRELSSTRTGGSGSNRLRGEAHGRHPSPVRQHRPTRARTGRTPPSGWATTPLSRRPASNVSASEWSTVARQLEAEFSYVEALYTWFGNVDDFLAQVFDEKILSVATVDQRDQHSAPRIPARSPST